MFLFLILCPLQAPTARNKPLAQHPDPMCFRGHALTIPTEQFVLPTAAPADKGEFEAARLKEKQLSNYLFFLSPGYAQRMARQSFLENAGRFTAGRTEPVTRLHSPWGRIADINPTTVTNRCKCTLSFLHCGDAGSCLCLHTRQKEIIASPVSRDHTDHSGSLLIIQAVKTRPLSFLRG